MKPTETALGRYFFFLKKNLKVYKNKKTLASFIKVV